MTVEKLISVRLLFICELPRPAKAVEKWYSENELWWESITQKEWHAGRFVAGGSR